MAAIAGRVRLTAVESFWYVLGCIAFGGMYFAKVPAKKALSEAGLAEMTGAERFWYVLQCIAFGAGYFAKIPVKKALTEMTQVAVSGDGWSPWAGSPAQIDQPGPSRAASRPNGRHGHRQARDQMG